MDLSNNPIYTTSDQFDKRPPSQYVPINIKDTNRTGSLIERADYYIIKVVLILTTAIVGLGFLAFAVIHVWKFLKAAMN